MNHPRQVICVLIFFTIFVFTPLTPLDILPLLSLRQPTVVVVGDFQEEGFGAYVKPGIIAALPEARKELRDLDIQYVDFPDPPIGVAPDLTQLHQEVISAIAVSNVVAIISASASQVSATLTDIARSFRIPLLLTVATNDRLTMPASPYIFRLLPKDQLQANVLANAIRESSESRVAVLYDTRAYGFDLKNTLINTLGPAGFMSFAMGQGTDIASMLDHASHAHVTTYIVLGYRDQAIEVLSKMTLLDINGRLLLSDGAYGTWLKQLPTDAPSITLIFPHVYPSSGKPNKPDLRSYAPYGFDALLMVSYAVSRAKEYGGNRSNVATILTQPDFHNELKELLIGEYNFLNSENTLGKFVLYKDLNVALP